jgi:hypothetical protein
MDEKQFFANARRTIESMAELGKFIGVNWEYFGRNGFKNSPDQQGKYDSERLASIATTRWEGADYEKMITSYVYADSSDEPFWRIFIHMILKHPDLEISSRHFFPKTDKKTYWLKANTYFEDTGILVVNWSRSVDRYYTGDEGLVIDARLMRKDWPALASSWDQMQVMKRMCPDDAHQLPDFI